MSQYQISPRISLETSVLYLNSKFASFWLYFEQADRTRPRKKLGYEVNFPSTASGTIDQYTVFTPSPQRYLALIYYTDQIPDFDVKLAKSYDT